MRLVKGNGDYAATFSVIVYASTPSYIIELIRGTLNSIILPSPSNLAYLALTVPLTIIVAIYTIYLEVIGISIAHKISRMRALFAIFVIPLLIIVVVLLLALVIFVALFLLVAKQNVPYLLEYTL